MEEISNMTENETGGLAGKVASDKMVTDEESRPLSPPSSIPNLVSTSNGHNSIPSDP